MLKGVIGANKGEKIELLNMKVFNLTLRIDTYMYICIYIKKILLQFYFFWRSADKYFLRQDHFMNMIILH